MKKNKYLSMKTGITPYFLLALISMILFLFCNKVDWVNQTAKIEPLMILAILLVFGGWIYRIKNTGWQSEDMITVLLLLGFIMRIGYTMYTYYFVRAHDIGTLDPDFHGHATYIWNLFTKLQLPDSYNYQYYHPPFFHLMSVIPLKITSLVFPDAPNEAWLNSAKLVSCFASCAGLLVIRRLCRELSLKNTTTAIALGIVALHPNFFLMAGRINNDSLMIFFQMLILLYTVKWYHNQSVGNTLVLAVAFGLGTMTKLSCATMAVFTGPVLVYVWLKNRNTKNFWKILGEGALFLAVCAPLALWYPIRNFVLFGQPLNYVPYMGEGHDLYVGNHTIIERFLSIALNKLFDPLYCQPFEDYNIALYLFKNSVFGEFEYDMFTAVAKLLVITNILLITVSLAACVYVLVKGKRLHPLLRFGMPFVWLTQLIFYYSFQIKYPFGCTMDFRYIPITVVTGALMTGAAAELLKAQHPKISRYVRPALISLICLFCGLSITAFCTLK